MEMQSFNKSNQTLALINETHKMEIKWQIDDKKKEEGGET